ncbi:glutathionylspermidine synthase family protein [Chengkuizengella sediminis]|uniref:glutathionylspermidine synthase family protein n=1 Tax=Chengkuizengella sediminis TaxID=1885917 RepID=UPI003B8370AB
MDKAVYRVVGSPHPNRQERMSQLEELGFTWGDLDHYWIDQVVSIDQQMWDEIKFASQNLWTIFDKAARFTFGKRDLYALLSIPEVLWDALDLLLPNEAEKLSRYARFDYSITEQGEIKLFELNADTPTGYVESSVVTPWICDQYELNSPNVTMKEQIRLAWEKEKPDYATCIAYGEHLEDSGTIDMLVKHSGLEVKCIDTLELSVDDGVVKDKELNPVRSMFALYPKEWMAVDDGGEALAYSIESKNIEIFNSLHSIILQSKGLQAVIWGLHELDSEIFTKEEHECIEKYMLPTYNKPIFDGNYVSKSMFGREGGSVRLYDHQGTLETQDEEGYDTSVLFDRVYQKRIDLPKLEMHTGAFHLLTGIFMINGEPCGLLGRAGGLITGNSSHFIAMGVR